MMKILVLVLLVFVAGEQPSSATCLRRGDFVRCLGSGPNDPYPDSAAAKVLIDTNGWMPTSSVFLDHFPKAFVSKVELIQWLGLWWLTKDFYYWSRHGKHPAHFPVINIFS